MITAKEAKEMTININIKNKEAALRRAIKETERRVQSAIESGSFWIKLNPNHSCLNDIVEYFKTFGYKFFSVANGNTIIYMIWDEESFKGFLEMEGIEYYEEDFEGEQHDTGKSEENSF